MHTPYATTSSRAYDGPIQADKNYAGYKVCDPRGRNIGRTERVFLNGNGEPEYIGVKVGLFGFKTVLLPVQSVVADEERRALFLQ